MPREANPEQHPTVVEVTPADYDALKQRHLMIPVTGADPRNIRDTFNEARSGGRKHEATDISAPVGTPVVAADEGTVKTLFLSRRGGLTVYQFDSAETYCYYYAHLDSYAAGLKEGARLKRGDLVGYVGSTGDASEASPHLHFAIFKLGPEKHWWQGTPVNPYPILMAKSGRAALFGLPVPSKDSAAGLSGGKIPIALRRPSQLLLCAVALLLAGCPSRQTTRRLVYVASPPPPQVASSAGPTTETTAETIVIEPRSDADQEPQTTDTTDTSTPPESAPKRPPRRRRPPKPDATVEAEDDAEPASPEPAGVPALAPRRSSEQEAALRRELVTSQANTRQRLALLDHARLTQGDRKTLDDARAFLTQSQRELEQGELDRSMNLARKAALLVSAVEQHP